MDGLRGLARRRRWGCLCKTARCGDDKSPHAQRVQLSAETTRWQFTRMLGGPRLQYGERCPECGWASIGRYWKRPWYRLGRETAHLACESKVCGARQRERERPSTSAGSMRAGDVE